MSSLQWGSSVRIQAQSETGAGSPILWGVQLGELGPKKGTKMDQTLGGTKWTLILIRFSATSQVIITQIFSKSLRKDRHSHSVQTSSIKHSVQISSLTSSKQSHSVWTPDNNSIAPFLIWQNVSSIESCFLTSSVCVQNSKPVVYPLQVVFGEGSCSCDTGKIKATTSLPLPKVFYIYSSISEKMSKVRKTHKKCHLWSIHRKEDQKMWRLHFSQTVSFWKTNIFRIFELKIDSVKFSFSWFTIFMMTKLFEKYK